MKQAANDPHLRADLELERGRAYQRLAYLTGELGSNEKALELEQISLRIFESLQRSAPNNVDYRFEVANRHNELGALFYQMDRVEEAETSYLAATKELRALAREHPDRLEFDNSVGRSENNLGLLYEATLRMKDALIAQESARDIFLRLSNKKPDNVEYRYHLASSLHNLGRLHQIDGRLASAESAFQESTGLLLALAATEEPTPDWTYLLGMTENHLGWLYETTQRWDDATNVLQNGLQRMKELVASHPDVPKYQRVLAALHNQSGRIKLIGGDMDGAELSFHAAMNLCQPLVDANPNFDKRQDLLARIHYNLGWLSMRRNNSEDGITEYQTALAIEQPIAREHPEVAEYRSILGWIHGDLAAAYAASGELELAANEHQASYDIWKDLATSGTPQYLAGAATALENWGDFHAQQGQHDLAEEKMREAIQIRRQLLERNQAAEVNRRQLALSMFELALNQGNAGHTEEAVATYQEILQIFPNYPEAHCNLGHKLQQLGQFSAAVECFRRGHELGSQFATWSYPSDKWLRRAERHASIESKLAEVVAGLSEADDAEQWLLLADACDASLRPGAAARMYQKAFAADASLARDLDRGLRYLAASCAARACAGEGNDSPLLSPNERARWHKQAIAWLRADLVQRKELLPSASSEIRDQVRGKLERWKRDADLAGVREGTTNSNLSASQVELENDLWRDVDALIQETRRE